MENVMRKILILTIFLTNILNAQSLEMSVKEVLSNNPIIQERLKNYNATKEDITYAKSGYYPKLDLTIGAGYEDTDNHDRPGIRDEGFSSDVYENTLKYTQNIFTGFQTFYNVKEEEYKTAAAAYSYIEKVDDTAFRMVDTYLQVMKNNELLQTAKENIEINEKIFNKVQKLYDSGLTTLSEVNKIESSLSLAKSNYVVQENTLLDATYNMHKVLGRYLNQETMSKPVLKTKLPNTLKEATQFAIQNNPSLLVSNYNLKLSQATFKSSEAPFYPKFDIEISQSFNKNLSSSEGEVDRFSAMFYMKYNIFNGFSDSSTLQKSKSKIHQEVETKNELRRQVIEGLNLSWAAYMKLQEQMKHLQKYKEFSLKTLTLYAKEYDLGRRSLLDLLAAQKDFIGAKVQIINTQYNILFSKYRILDAMGILVSSIVGDVEPIYNNVGLNGVEPKNKDTLPIRLDKDKDLIVDEKDICSNSLSKEMKDIYGCESIFENTYRIERYSGFLFDDFSDILTSKSQKRFNDLIKQIKTYGFKNMRFDVFGNVDIDGIKEKDSYILSVQRAMNVKDLLIKAGVEENNITIHAQSNKAPLYTNELQMGRELNNRVDIVLRKLNKN
jgi:adhesin transport system outer membrane protein